MIIRKIFLVKSFVSLKVLHFIVVHAGHFHKAAFFRGMFCVRTCNGDKGMLVSVRSEEFYRSVVEFAGQALISKIGGSRSNEELRPGCNVKSFGDISSTFQLLQEFQQNFRIVGVQGYSIKCNVRRMVKCNSHSGNLSKLEFQMLSIFGTKLQN